MGVNVDWKIRDAGAADAAAICSIYNHYIATSIITFEESPVPTEDMSGRIREIVAALPWYVCERGNDLLGFAYASPWKSRCAYRFSAETTIYLEPESTGRGIGQALYGRLIGELRARSYHSAIGGVALPNDASVALHEKLGFEKVAHFKQVGWKFNRWIDVGYWELLFE